MEVSISFLTIEHLQHNNVIDDDETLKTLRSIKDDLLKIMNDVTTSPDEFFLNGLENDVKENVARSGGKKIEQG